jgi:hypothetical protein
MVKTAPFPHASKFVIIMSFLTYAVETASLNKPKENHKCALYANLEYGCPIRSPPSIEKVVFSS